VTARGEVGALEVQMPIKANQFTQWSTEQLREWVEGAMLLSDSLTLHIFETCLQAVEELNIRDGIYEELESIHRC
jgi:hypothetical protein